MSQPRADTGTLVAVHGAGLAYGAHSVLDDVSLTLEPGRITTLIETGDLFKMIDRPALNPETDRVMICGSMAMLEELKTMLEARGFEEGSNAKPGDFVVEKAFAGEGV